MNRDRPLVLFSITTGWGIRNFIHTGLFERVRTFADIAVVASTELFPYFREQQAQGQIAWAVELPAEEPKAWQFVRQAKKAVLQGAFDISTARIKRSEKARGSAQAAWAATTWFLQSRLAGRWQIDRLEQVELRFARYGSFQLPQLPRLMVNCSPFDPRDTEVQRQLHRHGVPAIAIIPSWDNPSTKGCIASFADRVLAWGPNQQEELLGFYPGLARERVRISGIPQFDQYYQPLPPGYDREAFLGRLGIDAGRRVILYATCSERLFPGEPDVVAEIAGALEQGRFGPEAHLLVRCHPADRPDRYRGLEAHDRVTVVSSSRGPEQTLFSWTPPKDEIPTLAATLVHSDVCINTASTMTLDAFACGRPVVNIAYDGGADLPYHQSVRRYYDFHHYRPIAQSGAVALAHSAAQLVESIAAALEQPDGLRSQREAVVALFCQHPPEGSVNTIVGEIEAFVR